MNVSDKGLVQVYSGPGKGKTTAATGLVVRALGHGHKVLLVRLLKSSEPPCGELRVLTEQPGFHLIDAGIGVIRDTPDPELLRQSIETALTKAREFWETQPLDLLVFDEINNVLHRGLLSVDDFWSYLGGRPEGLEVVLTGRYAPEALMVRADLVTWMENRCHPLQRGIPARAGIDY